MVSESKNGKLYIFQKNGFSIKKWFPKIWFLNQKMENYIFFKKMVSQKNGFSIKKWKTIFWKKFLETHAMVSQSKNGFHHIYKNIMIYMFEKNI